MTPELLGNEEKYHLYSQEGHLVMISWGMMTPDGLIIRKFEYARMTYSLHFPCIQRIITFLLFKHVCVCVQVPTGYTSVRSSGTRIAGSCEPIDVAAGSRTLGPLYCCTCS